MLFWYKNQGAGYGKTSWNFLCRQKQFEEVILKVF